MPDNDLVPKRIRRLWSRPCNAMLGGQEPLLVGHEIDRSLATTLKDIRLPSPEGLVRAMRESVLYSDTSQYEEARARYATEAGRTDLASRLLAQAEELMEFERARLLGHPERELAEELLTAALRRHAEACLCGPAEVDERMLASGASFEDVRTRQEACLDAAQYDRFAARVLSGDTDRMRTPRSQIPRASTAALLEQVVE